MDITIVTTAPTNAEAMDLLKMMGLPFAEAKVEHKTTDQTAEQKAAEQPAEPKTAGTHRTINLMAKTAWIERNKRKPPR